MDGPLYAERLSSLRTEALFLVLTGTLLGLLGYTLAIGGSGVLVALLLAGFALFLFYSLNYRTLSIRITRDDLRLTFGLFSWRTARGNVESCTLDTVSLWRIGGAGIHFTSIGGRYRVMFNFLEYPRVVVALRAKAGPVRDVVFSSCSAAEVQRLLQPDRASPPVA
jgi:hypothetical protein